MASTQDLTELGSFKGGESPGRNPGLGSWVEECWPYAPGDPRNPVILLSKSFLAGMFLAALWPAGEPGAWLGWGVAGLSAQGTAMDTTSLAVGRYSEASALLEKTLLRIDVARLRIRFDTETALGLGSLLEGHPRSDPLADAAVGLVLQTRDAWASLSFQRNVSFDRFVDGILDGVHAARDAGLLDPAFAQSLSDSLPLWYSPLRERGVKDGDTMVYRIRGDSLHTVFRTIDGQNLVDQIDVGPQPRLSVLGGFLAPGSDFRNGLLNSIFDLPP